MCNRDFGGGTGRDSVSFSIFRSKSVGPYGVVVHLRFL